MTTSAKINLTVAPSLEDYVFTERLGSGTYATVYKAYRKKGHREVIAVKCVKRSSLNRASSENLLTEIELLKTLRHPNIVQLKDFKWDANYIYLIMEHCSGGDLSAFIRTQRTISEYLAKRFLQQIALALQYMRHRNVSHMDLKPQNILLSSTQPPCLKIGDFGFAHYLLDETETPYLRGSPLYMAPEIVIHKKYNEKADLWSVGVILYECLFGRAPLASQTLNELSAKIRDSKPIEVPEGQVSRKCRDLLHGLLQRNPDQRMSMDEFFSHPFIDLEHRPTNEALDKAAALITKAVERDKKQDYQGAVNYYCKSLEYFIPAIHFENNAQKKQALRQRIKQYIERAEELKQKLKPKPKKSTSAELTRSDSENKAEAQFKELVNLSCDNKTLAAALTVIDSAQQKEAKEEYRGALEQYQLALESLLKLSAEELPGRRKELLKIYLPQWMSHAEDIKSYLDVLELSIKDTSQQEEQDDQTFLNVVQQQRQHSNQQHSPTHHGNQPDVHVNAGGIHDDQSVGLESEATPNLLETQSKPKSFMQFFTKRKSSPIMSKREDNEEKHGSVDDVRLTESPMKIENVEKAATKGRKSPMLFGFKKSNKKYATLDSGDVSKETIKLDPINDERVCETPENTPSKPTNQEENPTGSVSKRKSFFGARLKSPAKTKTKQIPQEEDIMTADDVNQVEEGIEAIFGESASATKSKDKQLKDKLKIFRRTPAAEAKSKYDTLSGSGSDSFGNKTDLDKNLDSTTTVVPSSVQIQEEHTLHTDDEHEGPMSQQNEATGFSKIFSRSPLSAAKLPNLPKPKVQGKAKKYLTFSENDENFAPLGDQGIVTQTDREGSLSPPANKPNYCTLDYYTSDSDTEPNKAINNGSKAQKKLINNPVKIDKKNIKPSKSDIKKEKKSPSKCKAPSPTKATKEIKTTPLETGVEDSGSYDPSRGFENIGFRTSTSQHSVISDGISDESSSGNHGNNPAVPETKWALMQKQIEEEKKDAQCVLQ